MEVEGTKHLNRKNYKCGITYQKIDELNLLPMKYAKQTVDLYNKSCYTCIQVLNHWISVPADKLAILEDIIICVSPYVAIDDIYDSTGLRHGIPTTHKIFGIENTVIAFDFQMCCAMEKVLELNQPKAMDIFFKAWRLIHAGVGMELYWRDKYICPTEEEYNEMAVLKTSSIFRMLEKFMQMFDSPHTDAQRFLSTMGLYFQISNDYCCLTKPSHFASKGFCDDVFEGKFSFPIVHAINTHPEVKDALIDTLKKRTSDIEEKNQCLAILKKCGSFEYTENKLKKLEVVMLEEANKLGGNPHLQALIKKIRKAV